MKGATRRQRPGPLMAIHARASSTRRVISMVILLVVIHLEGASAQSPSPYPTWAKGKIFSQDPKDVIARTLPVSTARGPIMRINTFFEQFSRKVDFDTREKNQGESDFGDVAMATCNMQDSDSDSSWAGKARTYLQLRGLKGCETNCSTEREVEDSNDATGNGTSIRIVNTLEADLPLWAKILNSSAVEIAAKARRRWGKDVSAVSRFEYPDRENQNCTLWHTMGIRIEGVWYVQARVTTDTSTLSPTKVDTDNSYLIEHLAYDKANDRLEALEMRLPKDANVTRFKLSDTSFEVWSRPSPDSVGVNADVSRNIAFRAALAKGDNEHQQAQDAEQVSNTAILLLPLAMNLVPVALIADVNTFGMLLYTALTDVLTTVPLCIKGVELINISKSKYTATSAQITGNRGLRGKGFNETQVAEAWVAQCTLKKKNSHFQRGVIFVVLSISLMIFGVACEFFAKWWVKNRRRNNHFFDAENANHPNYAHSQPLMPHNHHGNGHGNGNSGSVSSQYQLHQYPQGTQQQATYGNATGHQPFAAAALAMQNRQQALRDPSGGMNGHVSRAGASPHSSMASGHVHHAHHAHNTHHTQLGHGGNNCICACHSSGQGPIRPEYDSRSTPDQMARKYH